MKRLTPASLLAFTSGRKQSKLIDLPSSGLRSNEGSLEMQARWITASQPAKRLANIGRIAQIALDLDELRIAVEAGKNVAVDIEIENGDLVAGVRAAWAPGFEPT